MLAPTEKILNEIVAYVALRKLEFPAVMALETIRPLAGSLVLLTEAFMPLIAPLFGTNQKQLQIILQDREFVSRLIDKLEDQHNRREQIGC
jgi:hypothetical protein